MRIAFATLGYASPYSRRKLAKHFVWSECFTTMGVLSLKAPAPRYGISSSNRNDEFQLVIGVNEAACCPGVIQELTISEKRVFSPHSAKTGFQKNGGGERKMGGGLFSPLRRTSYKALICHSPHGTHSPGVTRDIFYGRCLDTSK